MPEKQKTSKSKTNTVISRKYNKSRTLREFQEECEAAAKAKLIESFEVPDKLSTKSRYTTYKPVIDGVRFDSLMEGRYYLFLLQEKEAGQIDSFKMQVTYNLQPSFRKNKKTFRAIDYVADFVVEAKGKTYVIDTKGKETVEFKLKKKLFEYKYPELKLYVIQYCPEQKAWLELDEIRKARKKNIADRKQ